MQQKLLQKKYYYISKIDETNYSTISLKRKEKLDLFNVLTTDGCSESDGLARLEYESRKPHNIRKPEWSTEVEEKVRVIHTKFPLWGKDKIAVILKREHQIDVSISTTGRIISKLIRAGKIKSVAFYTGKYSPKPRNFNDHAQRLPLGKKGEKPGELIQIDHMTTKLDSGKKVKHFDAICPVTRISVAKAYRQATSLNNEFKCC